MRHALAIAVALAASLVSSPATAQTAASPATEYKAPRTPFGQPSLEGVWLSHSISELEALPGVPNLVVPETGAKALSDRVVDHHANLPFNFLDPEVPELFREAGRVNGLNKVRGERRTRQLVLPADGRMPFTPAARRQADQLEQYFTTTSNPPPSLADGPEQRPVWERYVALGGAPPISNPQTGHPIQIFQTGDHFIFQEEYHNGPRIIPYTDKHKLTNFRSDLGDAIARWEGDTLVIETINFHAGTSLPASSSETKVVERLTRVDADTINYEFTVTDPSMLTGPWSAKFPLNASDELVFEYACHEGNYAMPNILKGARLQEKLKDGK